MVVSPKSIAQLLWTTANAAALDKAAAAAAAAASLDTVLPLQGWAGDHQKSTRAVRRLGEEKERDVWLFRPPRGHLFRF